MKTGIRVLSLPLMLCFALVLAAQAHAGLEWNLVKNIDLLDAPRDLAVSPDGSKAYVLCDRSIQLLSIKDRRLTGSLPVGSGYSRIAIASGGDELLVTGGSKQVSIIQLAQVYDLPQGSSPAIGNPASPVSITAFLDYQCPYCSKSYPLLEQVLAKYPDTVKLVIKHFPLKFHSAAEPAAIAALASARQGKYKELSAQLMQLSGKLSEQAIRQAALQSGMDMVQFDAALRDPAIKKQIGDDMALGSACDVRGVPSIYINGRAIKSYTLESLSQMIERELKKS